MTALARPNYSFKLMSLLIVEDNAFLAKLLEQICQALGFANIRKVATAEAALGALVEGNFDFVVCDWDMRKVDCIGLVKKIRAAKGEFRYVPVIMLTEQMSASTIAEARDAGVTEFVVKPMSPQVLLARFVHIIEQPRQFVTQGQFVGPDRRRRKGPQPDGEDRRKEGA